MLWSNQLRGVGNYVPLGIDNICHIVKDLKCVAVKGQIPSSDLYAVHPSHSWDSCPYPEFFWEMPPSP